MQNFPCMHGLWYVIGQMIQDIHLKMTESTTCTLKHSILLGRFRDYSPLRHIAVLVHDGLAYTTCLLHRFQPSNNGRYMIVHRQSNRVLTSSSITSPGTLNLADRNNSLSQQWIFREIGGYYTIANNATGLYLDGDGSVSTATAKGIIMAEILVI